VKPSELAATVKNVEAGLAKWPSAFPNVIVTSGHDSTGIPQVRAAVARLLNERKR
jgi:GTP-binding protein